MYLFASNSAYWAARDDPALRVQGIHYEQDLIIFNETQ